MNKPPPKGIYLAAVVFFAAALLAIAELGIVITSALGINPAVTLRNMAWVLPGYVLILCLVTYGAAMLVRMHPAPRWLMLAMTVFLAVRFAIMPARNSPFTSEAQIYFNRLLLLSALVANSAYLWWLRSRSKLS